MAPGLFRVKAVYDYSSPHEDDLNFPAGQLITVTEEEGDDWYVGEYVDDNGSKKDGLFPKNFVEKYEPEPPPRPNRASRHKPLEQPQAQEAPPPPPQLPPQDPFQNEVEPAKPAAAEVPLPLAPKSELSPTSPTSATSARAPEPPQEPAEPPKPAEAPKPVEAPRPAPPPAAATPAKKGPPPVAAKSSSFRDRIAAFNQTAAPPLAPFKPGGGPPSTFIKKPFVAPPPSRNAYIPPPTREQPPVKIYRREEDPEIAERQAQDQENAERAGLTAESHGDGEEEPPKQISLKERIALLQKQQAEQAQRAAALHKEKKKAPAPVKKRTEEHDGAHEEGGALEHVASNESRPRGSVDHGQRPRSSYEAHLPRSAHDLHARDPMSDANDADQSGAGETEGADGSSTSVEEDEDRTKAAAPAARASTAPAKEPDVGDEEGAEDEEEEEEDEVDEETRRKLELRERMAKMSGGMGMAGMFGGPLPMGGLPPKKKPVAKKSSADHEEPPAMPQRIPMFPGMPPVRSPEKEDRQLAVEKDDEDASRVPHTRPADEVPDVEDVASQPIERTPTGEHPPPVPAEKRPVPPPIPAADRPAPPPVPATSRPVPPVRSPSPGSESGDEMTDAPGPLASPRSPPATQSKRSSYLASDEPYDSPQTRAPPPIPGMAPTSPTMTRAPPPPPPSAAPPSRHQHLERLQGESEYEGDYDTDIAPGATHKDALKAHARQSSLNESTAADETPVHSPTTPAMLPPLPPTAPRAVPPRPPQQPPARASMDMPRAVPPPPPVPSIPPPSRAPQEDDDDEEYDPYRYAAPSAPRGVPPPPQSQPPPPQHFPPPPSAAPAPPAIPKVPQHQAEESSEEEDDLYSAPPPRKSHDRPPPPPPQSPPPPHHAPPQWPMPSQERQVPPPPPQERHAPPPPPQERPAPPPPPREPSQGRVPAVSRKSIDVHRLAQQPRASMDQSRPSHSQEFIASDIDMGESSQWWTRPGAAPPSLQGRKDILVEVPKSQSSGERIVHVLYMDYSQTIVSARFEPNDPSIVELEQLHEAPPARLRQDQLEAAHDHFGVRIAKDVESRANTVVGDGSPHGLIHTLLAPYAQEVLFPVSTRAFGALVYSNLANASTQQFDEIRPGDIISFRNAKFQGKHGAMHAKYSMDVGRPDHVGVVMEWDGSKKKVRVWEQGRESKKVKPESFRVGDLRSGEVRVWRVMSRGWVGWE